MYSLLSDRSFDILYRAQSIINIIAKALELYWGLLAGEGSWSTPAAPWMQIAITTHTFALRFSAVDTVL